MEFYINGIRWKIVYVYHNCSDLLRSDGSLTVGVTDFNKRKIFINNLLQGQFLRKVLIHEICHACMFSYGVILDIETEEIVCDCIATYGDEIIGIADMLFNVLRKIS